MSFLIKKNTTEDGNQSHDCREDEGQPVAACSVEDESSHIGPKASAQMVNRVDKTGKETDMQESVEPSKGRRNERSRNKIGKAKGQTKNIERDRALII